MIYCCSTNEIWVKKVRSINIGLWFSYDTNMQFEKFEKLLLVLSGHTIYKIQRIP